MLSICQYDIHFSSAPVVNLSAILNQSTQKLAKIRTFKISPTLIADFNNFPMVMCNIDLK